MRHALLLAFAVTLAGCSGCEDSKIEDPPAAAAAQPHGATAATPSPSQSQEDAVRSAAMRSQENNTAFINGERKLQRPDGKTRKLRASRPRLDIRAQPEPSSTPEPATTPAP